MVGRMLEAEEFKVKANATATFIQASGKALGKGNEKRARAPPRFEPRKYRRLVGRPAALVQHTKETIGTKMLFYHSLCKHRLPK